MGHFSPSLLALCDGYPSVMACSTRHKEKESAMHSLDVLFIIWNVMALMWCHYNVMWFSSIRYQRHSASHPHGIRYMLPINLLHYDDVTMSLMASQITSLTGVYSTVYSGADQRKHQSSASLAFVRGIHRGPVNSPHKWPVTRKMFPFDDVIMPAETVTETERA